MKKVATAAGVALAVVAALYIAGVAYVKMVECEVFKATRARRAERFGR